MGVQGAEDWMEQTMTPKSFVLYIVRFNDVWSENLSTWERRKGQSPRRMMLAVRHCLDPSRGFWRILSYSILESHPIFGIR